MSPIKHSVFLRTRDAYAACVPGIVDVPHVFAQHQFLILDPRTGRDVFALWQNFAVVHDVRDASTYNFGKARRHDVSRSVRPNGVRRPSPLFLANIPVK